MSFNEKSFWKSINKNWKLSIKITSSDVKLGITIDINPFHATGPFWYPLKTTETLWLF